MARSIQQILEEIRARLSEIEEIQTGPSGPKPWLPPRPEDVPIPAPLLDERFQQLFREFIQHRKLKDPKDHWTPIAAQRKLQQLSRLGLQEACRWVEFALDNGLKNIQEPFQKGSLGTPSKPLARPPRKCAQCGVTLERSSYPSSKGEICPLCHSRR